MKFKRVITLAILAAVLSANLASCVAEKQPTDGSDSVYTDNNGSQTLPVNPTEDPSGVEFETVSKSVYVSVKSDLQKVGSTSEKVSVAFGTELTVTAQSKTWYKVSYSGAEYFIARGRTTEDDLGEKTFVACDKTMYINSDGVNVRPYPSLGSFSNPIATKTLGDQVKVIKQSSSTGWSKVEFTQNSKTVQGFIKTSLLTTNPTGEKDYEKQFTAITEKTVYVNVEFTLNLRETPYLPDDDGEGGGIIVGGKGVPRGTAVTAIAEGTVDGVVWYKLRYRPSEGERAVVCYGVKKNFSDTRPTDATDPETLIREYNFTKFSSEITAYVVTDSLNVRSTPSGSGSIVANLQKKNKLYAIAYGKSTTGYMWCLVRTEDNKHGFVNFENLTTNADGTKAPLPLPVDALISIYGFTKVSETKTSKTAVKLYGTPEQGAAASLEKPAGTSFEVLAKGSYDGEDYYLVQVDGNYYFAVQTGFN